jgi:DMSO/TMAO reductase YedYZ molybdopterin-dependent catalytic subunit
MTAPIDRRSFGARALEILAISLLAGCDRLAGAPAVTRVLSGAESVTRAAHALLVPRRALAQEFSDAELSPSFPPNGSIAPGDEDYVRHAASRFADWRLEVDGLVERAASFSLAELRALPSRTQITRHDCVEGWSAIGKWTGVRLASLLDRVGVRPEARYVVFHCADALGRTGDRYYESIDVDEARHEQTILAYDMNGQTLPVAHGAPLRLRVERQLGYKMAKYVMRIELVTSLAHTGRGRGGYWEDRGYEWFAGI